MEMMVLKQASRSISRMPGSDGVLLDGQSVSTSDLDFVIDEVRLRFLPYPSRYVPNRMSAQNIVHVAESTVGRRYAGWFIRNAEGAERAYDGLKALPVPGIKPVVPGAEAAAPAPVQSQGGPPKAVSFVGATRA